MNSVLNIVDVTAEDAATISALALRSKAYWGYSNEFIEQCRAELTYSPEQLKIARFRFRQAKLNGKTVGFYCLKQISCDQFEIEALFVEPEYIGKGVGKTLLSHAIEWLRSIDVKQLLIASDPHAEIFYLQCGAKHVGSIASGSIAGRELPLLQIDVST